MKTEIQPVYTNGQASRPTYTIVTQVKSNRVVYFTDDPDYSPPMEEDWYYISSFDGEVPRDMTLRNCWRWRFNGGVFSESQSARQAVPAERKLLDHNRKALLQILKEKIDLVRAGLAPSCRLGTPVRQEKLREATAFLAGEGSAAESPFLEAVAAVRHISLAEAARLISAKAQATREVLAETEKNREQFAEAISAAQTEAELLAIRERLLDEAYPHLTGAFAFEVDKTRPVEQDRPLSEVHLRHERSRLRVQLRERINAKRTAHVSPYVLEEVILRRKAALAEEVIACNGRAPDSRDFSLLENYARQTGASLLEASRDVMAKLEDVDRILVETEKAKDSLLVEIARAGTLRDTQRISTMIDSL